MSSPTPRNKGRSGRGDRGFSFIELSVSLVVIGLVISLGMQVMDDVVVTAKTEQARKQLDEVVEAVIGFAIANNRLPCPDTGSDGLEDIDADNICTAEGTTNDLGNLPYETLGLPSYRDPWGRVLQYAVYMHYQGVSGHSLTPPANTTYDLAANFASNGSDSPNRSDFCAKLTSADAYNSGQVDVNEEIHMAHLGYGAAGGVDAGDDADSTCSANSIKMAFVVASSGFGDADQATNGGASWTFFDGANDPQDTRCWENQDRLLQPLTEEQASVADNYDDIVRGVGLLQLLPRLHCQ